MSKSIPLICMIVLWTASAMAQGTNATLSGSVVDPSGALMAGVTLTLENVQTGVKFKSPTNETGLYQFPSIQPGLYRLTAERPAFQTLVYNNLVLEVSAQVNLALEIAQIRETVEVTADLDSTLAATTPSVGGVINGIRISDLPRADRDALGLVGTQAGIVDSNFAGARKPDVNVTRDGINVMNQISNRGVNSVIQLSTDLVDEIRVITSPADAELGRGSGQVQISTRSGTNEFHGSLFESHRNTALNANTFFNNQRGAPRDSLIRNQFGGRIGGPIVKNKTFFHFLFDAQREVTKNTTTAMVYTATAREGIFRFFPGVQNGNFNAAVPTVDINGNPLKPSAATGDLQSLNVFGKDPLRPVMDPTGTVRGMLDLTPLPNNFRVGDGLNSGGHTWNRRATSDRDQYNVKIDHHFSDRYRFNFNWTHQEMSALNGYAPQTFPQSPGGSTTDDTDFFSVQLTATLSSRLINEFRAGSHLERGRSYAPWELEGKVLLPTTSGIGYMPLFAALANFFPAPNNVFPPGSFPAGSDSSLTVIGDTLSWASGRHTLKFGGEVRLGKGGNSFVDVFVTPQANFGAGTRGVTGLNVQGIGPNQTAAQNLLVNLSGSLQTIMQRFYATSGANPVFAAIPEGKHAAADIFQREFSAFFKDDWNVKQGLTLNAGIHYEYYGVPWMIDVNTGEGKTPAVVGGSNGLYGLSGSSFADLYQPGHLTGTLTRIEFVGPHSPNPNRQLYNPDWNNFAPTVGLTWRIPYFGAEETVLRAGYGVGFEKLPLFVVGNTTGATPGLIAQTAFTSPQYLDLTRMTLPLTPVGAPLDPVPVTSRSQSIAVFDSNLRTGYVQNWSLSVQRQLPARMSLDVRYIGSKGTKLVRQIDINEANIFESGILDAFVLTQAGGNAPLLDQIFNGLDLGQGAVNGTTVTGSQSVRFNNNTQPFFANNNVGGFANYLNTSPLAGAPGELLRRASLPENLIVGNPQFGNAQTGSGTARIASNLANSTYHAMEIELNKRFSGGWTLQSSYTWSRTIGEHAGDSDTLIEQFYRNGRDRHLDKRLLPFHRTHAFKANGTFELPFGPNKRFLSGSNGLLSRIAERWQFGTILSLFSGQPISFVSQTSSFNQYTNNTPNLVGGLRKSFGNVTHDDRGVLYFPGLKIVPDPAVAKLTPEQSLNQASRMQAVADAASNSLIVVNPAPGTLGNMYPAFLEGPGQVRLDVNLVKRIRISETTQFEFRADAIDVLNHPNFANPNTDINNTNFGRIEATNGGNRIIVLNARINF